MNPHVDINIRIRDELGPLVRRLESVRFHKLCGFGWLITAVVMVAVLGGFIFWRGDVTIALLVLGGLAAIAGAILYFVTHQRTHDYSAAARLVERQYPDLRQTLTTAIEQRPLEGETLNFLQLRVIKDALAHARTHDWERVPIPHARMPAVFHAFALALVLGLVFFTQRLPQTESGAIAVHEPLTIAVTPGDTEVERGAVVVVTARFTGDLPREATLIWTSSDRENERRSMAQSLSDPVFAYTLPVAESDIVYRVQYAGRTTPAYHLAVYDLPSLLQADATLDYPAYTGLETRRIEDTRRVSAVEGTQLEYEFQLNKPVRRAFLRDSTDGTEIELSPANQERSRVATRFTLSESKNYTLHLEDDSGRANTWPDEVRIQALPNQRPELRVDFPRGDQRVSAIEEIRVRAEAADDFGLVDYGLGFTVGAADPEFVSLKQGAEADKHAAFQELYALESRGVRPDDLVTWFAWARDYGPDGQPRLTSGDLFFGEVRPFDEIFREGSEGSNAGNTAGGSEADPLVETQRQISIALWNLKQQPKPPPELSDDLKTLADAQRGAKEQLARMRAHLPGEREETAAATADDFMEKTIETLDGMLEREDGAELDIAWQQSQGAFQALLRLQPRENRVTQSRNPAGGRGGNNRNQAQLNQLKFRNNDDAYETESEAQALTSPEEREQLHNLSRLRELARRQRDLNKRLQELQTALTAAKDEQERDRAERELKRLEEEQRRMLADLDELRQRMDQRASDPGSRQARQQLDQTRDDMHRSGEALQQGSVSEALASGTRAQEKLEQARENLRQDSSSRFANDLRQARQAARDLQQKQESVRDDLQQLEAGTGRQLDDSDQRSELADRLTRNHEALDDLLKELRTITEAAEGAEPGLHQQLYDLLRQQGLGTTGDRLDRSAELLRRGFVEQANEMQPKIAQELDEVRRNIETATRSVLGDEATTMRFAQSELEDLGRALQEERPESRDEDKAERPGTSGQRGSVAGEDGGPSSRGSPGAPSQVASNEARGSDANPAPGQPGATYPSSNDGNLTETLDNLIRSAGEQPGGAGGGEWTGPITGGDYTEWSERLRTVESLVELPGARERLAQAREQAEAMRRDFRRHGQPPQWNTIENEIAVPLNEVRTWLRQEIARTEDRTALQPVDRDPVPDQFADAVKSYFESLGN